MQKLKNDIYPALYAGVIVVNVQDLEFAGNLKICKPKSPLKATHGLLHMSGDRHFQHSRCHELTSLGRPTAEEIHNRGNFVLRKIEGPTDSWRLRREMHFRH
jgi:hypothetical protein